MADEKLDVELVSVDRKVWTGEATFVLARTVDGEIGILPGHWDHLSVLVPGGVVDIREDDEVRPWLPCTAASCSVHDNTVRILAETAELGQDIDVERAARRCSARSSGRRRQRGGGRGAPRRGSAGCRRQPAQRLTAPGLTDGARAVSVMVALDGLAVLAVLALLGLALLFVRRRVITRRGGTFDCSLRLRAGQHGKGWVLGIGRYAGETAGVVPRVLLSRCAPERVLGRTRPAGGRAPEPARPGGLRAARGRRRGALPRRRGTAGRAGDEPGHPDRLPRLARVLPARHPDRLSRAVAEKLQNRRDWPERLGRTGELAWASDATDRRRAR